MCADKTLVSRPTVSTLVSLAGDLQHQPKEPGIASPEQAATPCFPQNQTLPENLIQPLRPADASRSTDQDRHGSASADNTPGDSEVFG